MWERGYKEMKRAELDARLKATRERTLLSASAAHEPATAAAAEIAGRVLAMGEIPQTMTFAALTSLLAMAAEIGLAQGRREAKAQ